MDSSLLAEEQGKSVQNSVFRRRLRIEEPMIKKANTTKSIACCLFGVPDPVESQNFVNNSNEASMFEFKWRWSFDPKTGEPEISASEANTASPLESSSTVQMDTDLKILQWQQMNDPIAPDWTPAPLLIAPSSESILREMKLTDDNTVENPSDARPADASEELFEHLPIVPVSIDEEENNISSSEQNSSFETTSPNNEIKFKSAKPLRQCRITEYMKVAKKIGRGKKLR